MFNFGGMVGLRCRGEAWRTLPGGQFLLRGIALVFVAGLAFIRPASPVCVGAQAPEQVVRPVRAPRNGNLLDLNTASAAQLAALPGMGAEYARRIVEGRPYLMKSQLLTRGVLPREAYARMKDRVVAHHPITAE